MSYILSFSHAIIWTVVSLMSAVFFASWFDDTCQGSAEQNLAGGFMVAATLSCLWGIVCLIIRLWVMSP